jgi:hypothetical protein
VGYYFAKLIVKPLATHFAIAKDQGGCWKFDRIQDKKQGLYPLFASWNFFKINI